MPYKSLIHRHYQRYTIKFEAEDISNCHGIFRVPIFSLLLSIRLQIRLIYKDEYSIVDSSLSDASVGALKGRNIRDKFVVPNFITNSAMQVKKIT